MALHAQILKIAAEMQTAALLTIKQHSANAGIAHLDAAFGVGAVFTRGASEVSRRRRRRCCAG